MPLGKAIVSWIQDVRKRLILTMDENLHRTRYPQPFIKRRLPHKRGATEQPNATGDGDAELTMKFWFFLLLTGIGAGLGGDLMMVFLFTTQHLAYHYNIGSFQAAVGRAAPSYRVYMLMLAGAIGGIAWYLISRFTKGEKSEVDDVVWERRGELSPRKSILVSIVQEIVIGLGASLGREAAPKLMGALSGSTVGKWGKLTPAQRRLLIACGAGAGLAAVYNIPLGGALFTAEVMLGEITIPTVLPALATSVIATVVAFLYLPDRPTYLGVPNFPFHTSELIFSIIAGPLIGLFAVGFIRLIGVISHHRLTGKMAIFGVLAAFTITGLIGMKYYQIFGNGKDMAHSVLTGHIGALSLLVALVLLKPLVTTISLGGGGSGGLFTPTLSTGAVLGGLLGGLWIILFPGSGSIGAFALIGAAAMMGAGLQAPFAAIAMVLELTLSGFHLIIPLIIATFLATLVARQLDGYSIYSARLSEKGGGE